MEAVREITEWQVDYQQPNHDYLLDGDRVLAYRKWGQGDIIPSKGNFRIDCRNRKFIKLDPNPFAGYQAEEAQQLVVEVKGSKGQTYYVNAQEGSCTCPGFQFRGECKHLKESK